MPDRLPIQDAKELAHKRGLRQVILLAWDGDHSHVVTYGKSIEDCDQAAQGGEKMKKLMGWPNWEAQPSRVKRLRVALERADGIIDWMASYLGRMAPPSSGIADLNEHWLEMQKLRKSSKDGGDWRGPRPAIKYIRADLAEAEIERLRAALKEIVNLGHEADLPHAWKIARASLSSTPESPT